MGPGGLFSAGPQEDNRSLGRCAHGDSLAVRECERLVNELPISRAIRATRGKSIAVDSLSTQGLLPRQSVQYWNEVVCNTFTRQSIDPLGTPLRAEMFRANVGEMRMAVATSSSSLVTRSREQVAQSSDAYFLLHLQLAGTSLNRQDGREVALCRGDFALLDSTRPYQIEFHEATSILVLRIAQSIVRRVIPAPEAITLLPIAGSQGAGRLASRLIQDVWTGLQDGMPIESAGRLYRPVLDLVASAYAAVPAARVEGSCAAGALRTQIRSFIEEHLSDQELSVASIAAAFGITCRYVHALFKGGRNTVSEYIQTRRIEEAARTLSDPLTGNINIGTVALGHGFKSQAHFSRLFRAAYGITPREFRYNSR